MHYKLSNLVFSMIPNSIRLGPALSPDTRVVERHRSGYGGRHLSKHHDHAEPEYEDVLTLMKGRKVFVDIGAHTGIYALRVARALMGKGTVICFEPNPEIASDLFNSIRINGLTNVRLRVCCVGDSTKSVTLWLNKDDTGEPAPTRNGRTARAFASFCMPLDHVVIMEQLSALDYLKIDANGSERAILEGGRRSIEKFRPIIQCIDRNRPNLPAIDGYQSFKIKGGRNRLMLHREDPRLRTVLELGYQRLPEPAAAREDHPIVQPPPAEAVGPAARAS